MLRDEPINIMTIASFRDGAMPDPAQFHARLFKHADADSSGSIDQAELATMLEHGPAGAQQADAQTLFTLMDSDGDGAVTEAEHSALLEDFDQKMKTLLESADGRTSVDEQKAKIWEELLEGLRTQDRGYGEDGKERADRAHLFSATA